MDNLLISILIGFAVGLAIFVFLKPFGSKDNGEKNDKEQDTSEEPIAKPPKAQPKPKKVVNPPKKAQKKAPKVVHHLQYNQIKGSQGEITKAKFSPSTFTSTDRTLKIVPESALPEKNIAVQRINLPYDHGTSLDWSEDGKNLIISLANSKELCAYQIFSKKNKEGKNHRLVTQFKSEHLTEILSLQISSNSKFLLSTDESTVFYVSDLHGKTLFKGDTKQVKNFSGSISPDSRFLAFATFSSDVQIFEVFTKNEEFSDCSKVMCLTGHKSSVQDLSFSYGEGNLHSHIFTGSKDGSIKLWDIGVNYSIQQDPKVLYTFQSSFNSIEKIAISKNEKYLVISELNSILFIEIGKDWKEIEKLENYFEGTITSLSWNSKSTILAVSTSHKELILFSIENI